MSYEEYLAGMVQADDDAFTGDIIDRNEGRSDDWIRGYEDGLLCNGYEYRNGRWRKVQDLIWEVGT